MDLMKALQISATGLSANRAKMNVIAENLANAEATRTVAGGPYRRKMVIFEASPLDDFKSLLREARHEYTGVKVTDVVESHADFVEVYNPTHPDADPDTGLVQMPNVDRVTELADMLVARRAYEANATAIANTRDMILKALELGK
jgi:flagellar basal-body rod protein FlgC